MTDDMHHKLSALDSSIKMLIRDSNQTSPRQRSKVKRTALLPFIGDLSHSLFGTATQKDLDILRRHINNMISVDKKSLKRHINIFPRSNKEMILEGVKEKKDKIQVKKEKPSKSRDRNVNNPTNKKFKTQCSTVNVYNEKGSERR